MAAGRRCFIKGPHQPNREKGKTPDLDRVTPATWTWHRPNRR